MSERVIPSDAVVCIDRFSGALVRKYRSRMIPGQPQRKRVSPKYARAAALMRKFPDTWVCLSHAKTKNSAQSYVYQLQHDSSPALPASEFGFRIHEVNDEWWVQATYFGKDD